MQPARAIGTAFACALVVGLTGAAAGPQDRDPTLWPLTPPARYITDIEVSEDVLAVVQQRLVATFVHGVRAFDWDRAAQGLSSDLRARFPRPNDGRAIEDDLLIIREYGPDGLAVVGRDGFLATIRAHVGAWTTVERASWQMFEFLLEPGGERAFAKAHLELGGPGSGGQRAVVNATVAVELRSATSDRWTISRLDLLDGMRVENPSPPFRDVTDSVGLHFNRSEANRRLRQDMLDTGDSLIDSGLNVVDWNRDGFWDIVAVESWNHAALFLNDGKGGFVRGVLPFSDRRLIPSQLLVVDLDNDGVEELVSNRVLGQDDRGWMVIYTRRNGEWVMLSRALEFHNPPGLEHSEALSITADDVNRDGLIDLFFAGYETNQSRQGNVFNRVDADDGSDNLLFINHGELRFTEESDVRGVTGARYTYVAQFFDFDADGDVDLLEGNDYGPNVVWDNQGDGTFRELPNHALARAPNYTMGLSIGDWDNTGEWGLYISNMYSHAGNRVVRVSRQSMGADMYAQIKLLAEGNELFVPTSGTGQLREVAQPLGVNDGGWAWGCLFYDLDNDGDKEIFVTNGNTSFADREAPDY